MWQIESIDEINSRPYSEISLFITVLYYCSLDISWMPLLKWEFVRTSMVLWLSLWLQRILLLLLFIPRRELAQQINRDMISLSKYCYTEGLSRSRNPGIKTVFDTSSTAICSCVLLVVSLLLSRAVSCLLALMSLWRLLVVFLNALRSVLLYWINAITLSWMKLIEWSILALKRKYLICCRSYRTSWILCSQAWEVCWSLRMMMRSITRFQQKTEIDTNIVQQQCIHSHPL